MKTIQLHCRDNAAFKPTISPTEGIADHFSSDSLWSTLVNIFGRVYPEHTERLIAAAQRGEWTISSLFPCLDRGAEPPIYLLPRPAHEWGASTDRKRWKKISWISTSLLQVGLEDVDLPACTLGHHILLRPEELPADLGEEMRQNVRFFVHQGATKVKVHTVDSTGRLYHQAQLHLRAQQVGAFTWQPHFYFLLDESPEFAPELRNKLAAVLRLLPDEGIGGERKTGLGRFEDVSIREDIPWETAGEARMSLSLVAPRDSREWKRFRAYRTAMRGGGFVRRSADPKQFQRQRLRMLVEGSIFTGEVTGRIADVSPPDNPLPWTIWRYGRCLSIPYPMPLS